VNFGLETWAAIGFLALVLVALGLMKLNVSAG